MIKSHPGDEADLVKMVLAVEAYFTSFLRQKEAWAVMQSTQKAFLAGSEVFGSGQEVTHRSASSKAQASAGSGTGGSTPSTRTRSGAAKPAVE